MIWKLSGYDVLIDEDDYERLKRYKYSIASAAVKKYSLFYFQRNTYVDGIRTVAMLHRDIMGCIKGDGNVVDHINRDTLDCRKANLRICSNAENSRNRKASKKSTSGIKGVSWSKHSDKWQAQITVDSNHIHLGFFYNIEEAAKAYEVASKKYHGEFGFCRYRVRDY